MVRLKPPAVLQHTATMQQRKFAPQHFRDAFPISLIPCLPLLPALFMSLSGSAHSLAVIGKRYCEELGALVLWASLGLESHELSKLPTLNSAGFSPSWLVSGPLRERVEGLCYSW